MATYTPPPYFPQSSLSPPDEKRYRKFKVIVIGAVLGLAALVGVVVLAVVYLAKWLW